MEFNDIYRGKKVLITGNTGFKGSWLTTWLLRCGAEVYGYSIDVPTNPSIYEILNLETKINHKQADICNKTQLYTYIHEVKPDFIFHLAAQALVSVSYERPYDTIMTNVMGTASILDVIKDISWECICVIITSDKAYENVEWNWGYRENDTLGGKDPYSASKGATELIISGYFRSYIAAKTNIKLGIARAGNVIGGGDWSIDRIVVDCIKSLANNTSIELRYPQATRPWQHVLEPLSGYLILAQGLYEGTVASGEVFNFGPRMEQNKTVLELVHDLAQVWGIGKIPIIKGDSAFNEATLLKLNCDKALTHLHWTSTLTYEKCINFVVAWYKIFYTNDADMYEFTLQQIDMYVNEKMKHGKI